MPSQPLDTGWHFGPVIDLIDSDLHAASPATPPLSPNSRSTISHGNLEHKASQRSLRLGNFGKLFEHLGITNNDPLQPVSPVDPELEEPVSSDDNLLPSLDVDVKDIQTIIDDVVNSSISIKDSTIPNGGPPKKTSNKTQTPGCKRKGKKERKAIKNAEKLLLQQELDLKDREISKSRLLHQSDRLDQLATGQVRAHSRSNVGAKLRPTTPVQLHAPGDVDNQPPSPAPAKEPAVVSSSHPPLNVPKPAPVQRLSSFAQPFTPARNVYGLSTPQPPYPSNPSPGWVNWVPAVAPQYTNLGTPSPATFALSSALDDPNSYFTPQVSASAVHGHGLVPRTVQPVVVQRPQQPVAPPHKAQMPITPSRRPGPIALRPQTERHVNFFNQLMFNFPEDRKWLVSPMKLSNQQTSLEGIHVFVDASNIMIGFKDMLRRNGVQLFDMSFDSLALLMERRRPVAKRVFAGSHREANPLPHVSRLVETSKAVGYENNVKEQVYIRREENDRKKFFKDVEKMGWNKAMQRHSGNGSGSDSETGQAMLSTPSAPKWVEQGVDEILHLKMCQSIIDTEVPTTIVLATGDGAEAEHSDGFLAHVERALKKGWQVELVSWKQQTSGGYKNKKFRARWGDNFRIIELDDYVESLINTP